jgi:hypothetical protein
MAAWMRRRCSVGPRNDRSCQALSGRHTGVSRSRLPLVPSPLAREQPGFGLICTRMKTPERICWGAGGYSQGADRSKRRPVRELGDLLASRYPSSLTRSATGSLDGSPSPRGRPSRDFDHILRHLVERGGQLLDPVRLHAASDELFGSAARCREPADRLASDGPQACQHLPRSTA